MMMNASNNRLDAFRIKLRLERVRERASVAIHLRKKLKSFAFDLALRILLHLFVWSASLAFSKRSLSSSLGVFFTCSPPPSAERFFFFVLRSSFFSFTSSCYRRYDNWPRALLAQRGYQYTRPRNAKFKKCTEDEEKQNELHLMPVAVLLPKSLQYHIWLSTASQ